MALWRQHHVVEVLREHRRGEEGDRPQFLRADIGEIVPYRRGEDEDAAGSDRVVAAFRLQLALPGNDVLRLFGGVGVPPELAARLDLVDDG